MDELPCFLQEDGEEETRLPSISITASLVPQVKEEGIMLYIHIKGCKSTHVMLTLPFCLYTSLVEWIHWAVSIARPNKTTANMTWAKVL